MNLESVVDFLGWEDIDAVPRANNQYLHGREQGIVAY